MKTLSPGEISALSALVRASELVTIELVQTYGERFHADNFGMPLVLPPKLNARVQFHMNSPKNPLPDRASFIGQLKVSWTDGDLQVAQMQVAYRAVYGFRSLKKPPSVALSQAFGGEIVTHHLWPFLRERARNVSMEIGMRPLLLPLRKLPLQEQAPKVALRNKRTKAKRRR